MKKTVLLVLSALLIVLLASCTTFQADGLSTYTPKDYEVLGNFEASVTVHKFIGSPAGATLFNIAEDATASALDNLIAKEVKKLGGSGAINIEVKYQATFINMLCASLTGNIWAPAKLTVSGTVIR
jgi:hypothetical protein